jgi:hypothetical protein
MSQFDKLTPNNGYPCTNNLLSDGETRYGVQTGNTTASAVAAVGTVISASTAYNIVNQNCRGALFYLRPTAYPGSGSAVIMLKIRTAVDPIGGGAQFLLATFPQVSGSAGYAYMVYPSALPTTGAFVSTANYSQSPLPRNYQALISLSAAATSKEVTFSLSVMHIL